MYRKRPWFTRKLIPILVISLGVAAASLTSCTNKPQNYSNEQLKQQAAQTTQNVKQQSKQAVQNARTLAANAEGKMNAIAAGVQQGLKSGHPASGSPIDINTAPESDLAALPGISRAKARQIVAHRPYRSSHQLVDRGLLTESQYAAISSDVTAR
jgi:DNA uptake protein ComE-like DNA-binding protein